MDWNESVLHADGGVLGSLARPVTPLAIVSFLLLVFLFGGLALTVEGANPGPPLRVIAGYAAVFAPIVYVGESIRLYASGLETGPDAIREERLDGHESADLGLRRSSKVVLGAGLFVYALAVSPVAGPYATLGQLVGIVLAVLVIDRVVAWRRRRQLPDHEG